MERERRKESTGKTSGGAGKQRCRGEAKGWEWRGTATGREEGTVGQKRKKKSERWKEKGEKRALEKQVVEQASRDAEGRRRGGNGGEQRQGEKREQWGKSERKKVNDGKRKEKREHWKNKWWSRQAEMPRGGEGVGMEGNSDRERRGNSGAKAKEKK